MIYLKYEHLISKMFKEMFYVRRIMYSDFKQECLMCLEKAIQIYKGEMNCSFYTFFVLIVKRRIYKLYKRSNLFFQEQYNSYDLDRKASNFNENRILKILLREIEFSDSLEKQIFEQCILNNEKITNFARKNNLQYHKAYLKYKKIKEKAEKILTNLLV